MATLPNGLRALAKDLEQYEGELLQKWLEECANRLDEINEPISTVPENGIVTVLALVKIEREFEAIHRYGGNGDLDWGVMVETAVRHGIECDWHDHDAVLRGNGRSLFKMVLAEQTRLAGPLRLAFGGAEKLTYSLWQLADCDDDLPPFKEVFPGKHWSLTPHMVRISDGYTWVLNGFDPPLLWS